MENKKKTLVTNENLEIQNSSFEVITTALGALAGLAIGGPIGAVISASASPVVQLAQKIAKKAIIRKQKRLEDIMIMSVQLSDMNINEILAELENNDKKTEDLFLLLSSIIYTDKSLDEAFSQLIAGLFKSKTEKDRERILIIGDAIKNFRMIHLKIIYSLYNHNGVLAARDIAKSVKIREVELRSVVRDLELRGIILDLEKKPVVWKLRELGYAIAKIIQTKKGK